MKYLVDADDDGVLGRRHVEPDHVGSLGDELGIVALAPGFNFGGRHPVLEVSAFVKDNIVIGYKDGNLVFADEHDTKRVKAESTGQIATITANLDGRAFATLRMPPTPHTTSITV